MERNRLGLLAVVVLPCVAWGLHVAVPPMVMPEFADTEVTTNIPVNVFRSDVRGLDVSLELCATPSNNVQVAFGRDADGDGVLAPEESDLVVGWDCGRWFAEEVATGARTFAEDGAPTAGNRFLRWRSELDGAGGVSRLAVTNTSGEAFAELSAARPGWACRSSWNMMRLTRRGTDMPAECFDVSFRYNVLHLIFR